MDTVEMTLKQALEIVRASDDYRVDEQLPIISRYATPPNGIRLYKGLGIDTETTGLDASKDKIIELSLIQFTYDDAGNIYDIGPIYSGFEDPKIPIPEEAGSVNKITDDMVKGESFDDDIVTKMINDSDLIIAHNSDFDRRLMDRRFPSSQDSHWGCSLRDVDWKSQNVNSKTLSGLMHHYGYFFEGHRSEIDVRAMIHVLAEGQDETFSPLKEVIAESKKRSYEVWAYGAPFDAKDSLKEYGFTWHPGDNGNNKAWHKKVSYDELLPTLAFVNEIKPLSRSSFIVEDNPPEYRFSDRIGRTLVADDAFNKMISLQEASDDLNKLISTQEESAGQAPR